MGVQSEVLHEVRVALCKGCPLSTPGRRGGSPSGHYGVHVHLPNYDFAEDPWQATPVGVGPAGKVLPSEVARKAVARLFSAAERCAFLPSRVRVFVPTTDLGADGLPDVAKLLHAHRDHPVWGRAETYAALRSEAVA